MAGWPQKALDLMTESPNLAAPSTFPGRKFGFQAKRSPTRTSSWPERTKKKRIDNATICVAIGRPLHLGPRKATLKIIVHSGQSSGRLSSGHFIDDH